MRAAADAERPLAGGRLTCGRAIPGGRPNAAAPARAFVLRRLSSALRPQAARRRNFRAAHAPWLRQGAAAPSFAVPPHRTKKPPGGFAGGFGSMGSRS